MKKNISNETLKTVGIGGTAGAILGSAGTLMANTMMENTDEDPIIDTEPVPNPTPTTNHTLNTESTTNPHSMPAIEPESAIEPEVEIIPEPIVEAETNTSQDEESAGGIQEPEPEAMPEPLSEAELEEELIPEQEIESEQNLQVEADTDSEQEIDIHILGVEQNILDSDGSTYNLGHAEIDGHAAMFIDIDNDQFFDGVLIDVNDNFVFDEGDFCSELPNDPAYSVDNFMTNMEDSNLMDNSPETDNSSFGDDVLA